MAPLLFIAHACAGQTIDGVWGAEAVARGGALVADTTSPWSALSNPAAAADTAPVAVLAATVAPTSAEPRRAAALAIVPLRPLTLSIAIGASGVPAYRETDLSLAAATRVSGPVVFGARAVLRSIAIERYGAASAIAFDLGARMAIVPEFSLGLAVQNVTGAVIGAARSDLPRAVCLGLEFAPVSSMVLTADVAGRAGDAGTLRLGARMQVQEYLALCGGVTSDPGSFAAGATVRAAGVSASYAYLAREDLGPLHVITIGWSP